MKPGSTILVTGVTGQVGHALAKHADQRLPIVLASRRPAEERLFGFPAVAFDLADAPAVKRCVESLRPALIINPAAYTKVDQAEAEPDACFAVNCDGIGALAEAALAVGAGLVNFSTDYVYGRDDESQITEDSPLAPVNVYGRSKAEGERLLRESGVPHLIFRTSWVYGVNGHNFVQTMLRLAATRSTVSVVNDQFGAPTSADSIARALWQILGSAWPDRLHLARDMDWAGFCRRHQGAYHLVNSGCTHWAAFARRIFALAEPMGLVPHAMTVTDIPTASYPTPARRQRNSRLSLEKLKSCFGVTPPSWESALAEALEELRQPHAKPPMK